MNSESISRSESVSTGNSRTENSRTGNSRAVVQNDTQVSPGASSKVSAVISSGTSLGTSEGGVSQMTAQRAERIAETREHIIRASVQLRGLGSDYERIAWMLEDTLDLLAATEADADVDFDSDFAVLTREFVPVERLSASEAHASDSEAHAGNSTASKK